MSDQLGRPQDDPVGQAGGRIVQWLSVGALGTEAVVHLTTACVRASERSMPARPVSLSRAGLPEMRTTAPVRRHEGRKC